MLSKSQFIRGRQCHKSLWLHRHRPELRDACTLGEPEENYQPFAFLVSGAPAGSDSGGGV